MASMCHLQGLQFFDLKLVGAVASYLHGSAFTIRKLGEQDGITQWSAPCFLQMHQLGLGLTVGEQMGFPACPCALLLCSTVC